MKKPIIKACSALYLLFFFANSVSAKSIEEAANSSKKVLSQIELDGDFTIPGTAEGFPVKLKVDPASPRSVVLNPEFALRASIKKSGMIGFRTTVGPIVVWGGSAVVNFTFDTMKLKQRTIIASKPYAASADGGAGPGTLPFDVIVFRLRPSSQSESLYSFPLVETPMYMDANSVTTMSIGGKDVIIAFSLGRSITLATAAAGNLLAEVYGGQFTDEIATQQISFGVERPVRGMHLSKPFVFLGKPISDLGVRVLDYGDATKIGQTEQKRDDVNEIVVTAQKSGRDTNRYLLILGKDDLAHCSSITFDKLKKQIRISCI